MNRRQPVDDKRCNLVLMAHPSQEDVWTEWTQLTITGKGNRMLSGFIKSTGTKWAIIVMYSTRRRYGWEDRIILKEMVKRFGFRLVRLIQKRYKTWIIRWFD